MAKSLARQRWRQTPAPKARRIERGNTDIQTSRHPHVLRSGRHCTGGLDEQSRREQSENHQSLLLLWKERTRRRKLVAGPHVFICDECVELSMVLVREEGGSFYLRSPAEYRKLAKENVRIAEAEGVPRDKAMSAVSRTWLRLAEKAKASN
jgi:hypothetical protein